MLSHVWRESLHRCHKPVSIEDLPIAFDAFKKEVQRSTTFQTMLVKDHLLGTHWWHWLLLSNNCRQRTKFIRLKKWMGIYTAPFNSKLPPFLFLCFSLHSIFAAAQINTSIVHTLSNVHIFISYWCTEKVLPPSGPESARQVYVVRSLNHERSAQVSAYCNCSVPCQIFWPPRLGW